SPDVMTSPTLRGDPVPGDPPRPLNDEHPGPIPGGLDVDAEGSPGDGERDRLGGGRHGGSCSSPLADATFRKPSRGVVELRGLPFDSGLVDDGPGECWDPPSPRGTLERSSPGHPVGFSLPLRSQPCCEGLLLRPTIRQSDGSEDASDRSKPEDDLPVRGLPTIQSPGLSLLHLRRFDDDVGLQTHQGAANNRTLASNASERTAFSLGKNSSRSCDLALSG
ncbi:hypothetical protein THAOC_15454, partial [Thalassiosira oceanica]